MPDHHVRADRRRRRQHAADHVVHLREHRREHRHHAADAPRRRRDAGAEDLAVEHFRSRASAGLPTFGNREISTTIRLKDGETNMLAGLIRDEERTVLAGDSRPERHPADRPAVRQQPPRDAADRHHPDADAAHRPRAGSDRSGPACRSGSDGTSGGGVARRDPRRQPGPPRDEPSIRPRRRRAPRRRRRRCPRRRRRAVPAAVPAAAARHAAGTPLPVIELRRRRRRKPARRSRTLVTVIEPRSTDRTDD